MKVSLIQCDLELGNVDANYELIENEIISAMKDNPDVIVLPEMWNTSFIPNNIMEIADRNGEKTIEFLSKISKENSVNIVGGSVANIRNGNLYNTAFIFNRNGELIEKYNKVHSFSPSGEHEIFKAGSDIVTFYLDDVKCGICICYDIRFLEWIRLIALKDIQILFNVAAWSDVRTVHWDTLNRARAIENQMFVVCVNSTGYSEDIKFGGHSAIIDPWGEYVISPDDVAGIKTGEIDLSVIQSIRERINVFRDRREDIYKINYSKERDNAL